MIVCYRWLGLAIFVAIPGNRCDGQQESQLSRSRQLRQSNSGYGSTDIYGYMQTPLSRSVCRGRIGYVADTTRNCQVFYNCMRDGTITTSTCPGNYQFDETTQCCKMPHDVNCAGLLDGGGIQINGILCTGKRGFYPDIPSGCRVFYFCEPSGRSRTLNCPEGLLFNEVIGCCDIAQNVRCGNAPLPELTSLAPPVDAGTAFCRNNRPGFYANPVDCSSYYYCQNNGRGNVLRCPNGQAFNELHSSCDNDLSRCYGVQVDRNVFDCSGRNGWYQSNDPNCRFAFYCNAGRAYRHSCSGNQRWNSVTLSCDRPENVRCGSGGVRPGYGGQVLEPITDRPMPQPTGLPNGYGPVTQSPFNDYTRANTRTPVNTRPAYPFVTTTHTSGGFVTYSTTTQYVSNTNPGLGIDNTYDCRGKIGYYAVVETGCSQFIYCNPEGIAHRFACPSTLLFNNSIAVCDWPQNVRCQRQVVPGFLPSTQSAPNYDCRGKDGFFADQSRGFRIFYMCHADGTKYQYVCPSNLVFNERRAVCDWPDYMQQGGFTPGSGLQTGGPQNGAVDWGGPPLDCRLRPAGFYANPTNNRIYARCTPDGTFFAMPCPDGTVFDQGFGLCVFPSQVGQRPWPPGPPGPTVPAGVYGPQDQNNNIDIGGQGNYGPNINSGGGTNVNGNGQGNYGPSINGGGNFDINGNGYQVPFGGTSTRPYAPPVVTTSYGPPANPVTQGTYVAQLRPYTGPGSQRPFTTTTGYTEEGFTDNTDGPFLDFTTQPNPPPTFTYPPYPTQTTGYQQPGFGGQYGQGEEYGLQSGMQHGGGFYGSQTNYGQQTGFGQQGNYGQQAQTGQGGYVQQNGGHQGGFQTGIQIGYENGYQQAPHPGYVQTPQENPAVCLGRTGMYADRSQSCRRYYVCHAVGTGDLRTCAGNLVFNEATGQCDISRNVNCFTNAPGIVQPAVPVCLSGNSINTFVPDVNQGCMTFYNCEQNGRGTVFRCPAGTQFNAKINACDDPRNCNCVAANGGTINIKIPVPTVVADTSYGNYQQQTYSNQNMDLDIRVRRPPITVGMMPLVPGYDESMYADATGTHARLPSFYSDDDTLANVTSMTLKLLFNFSEDNDSSLIANETSSDALSPAASSVDGWVKAGTNGTSAEAVSAEEDYFRLGKKQKKPVVKVFQVANQRKTPIPGEKG